MNLEKDTDFKILLINIDLRPNNKVRIFPIGLGYIATSIYNAGFNLEILDLVALRLSDDNKIEEYIRKSDFDVVAMGCIVSGYKYIKKLCNVIKNYKDVPIIIGNSVASSIPEILMNKTKTDIGVIGEGDITIVELLKALRDKTPLEEVKGIFFKKREKIIYTHKRDVIKDLNTLPFINYELFDMNLYLENVKYAVTEPYPIEFYKIVAMPVNTARGCPFNCSFCYHIFKNVKFRPRSIEHIGKEIKFLIDKYKVNYFLFLDELSLYSKQRAHEIADFILDNDLKIFWSADCRAGLLNENDLKLALKLKKSGCMALGFSLESADEGILKEMNKRITVEDFIAQCKVLHKAGIIATTSLVIGYPQEAPETLQKTFDVCYESNIYPSAGFLLPQPGTPIYNYAKKIGKIKDEEQYLLKMGDRQNFTLNLTNMKQQEIEEITKYNLKRISEKLELIIEEKNLIKTGHSIQKRS